MPISELPTAPSRALRPADFANQADAFLAALPAFGTEATALESNVNAKEASAVAAAATAVTKAEEASTSAGLAQGYAATADAKAGEAAGSASTATAAALGVDKRYLGAKSSAPSVDNQGAALQPGAVYYNTSTGKVMTWSGSAWVEGISAVSGVSSLNGMTGAITGFQRETAPKYTLDDDGSVSGAWAIDYANGPVIAATATGNITTINVNNWPASGTAGHLKLLLTNFGAYTITFPTSWKFTKRDMTTVSFAGLGITLPVTGTVIFDIITVDGGANVLASIVRN